MTSMATRGQKLLTNLKSFRHGEQKWEGQGVLPEQAIDFYLRRLELSNKKGAAVEPSVKPSLTYPYVANPIERPGHLGQVNPSIPLSKCSTFMFLCSTQVQQTSRTELYPKNIK